MATTTAKEWSEKKKHNMNEASTESNERRKKIVSNKFSASISLFILHSSAE